MAVRGLYLTLILLSAKTFAQVNLVPNPSFENYSPCPGNYSEIADAFPWFQPSFGTPDYFNSCCSTGIVGVPINDVGNQNARTGVAYAGFYSYSFSTDYREYIEAPLISPMEANKTYCVEFYVSLADTATYSISNLGIYFSNDSLLDYSTFSPFNVIPQLSNPIGNYLSDKNNWMKVSGFYTALGGERFITIGNFKTDVNTDTTFVGPNPFQFGSPYYYIDDVSIIECPSTFSIPNVFTPNNDGVNDDFKVFSDFNIKDLNCKIYDRWGLLVGELNDISDSWGGRNTSGIECTDGVYYYILSAKGNDGKEYNQKGFVQLLR